MDGEGFTGTEDEKEKTPEIMAEATSQLDQQVCRGNQGKVLIGMGNSNNNEGDSGIDANSQGSSASREEKMDQQNNKDEKESKDQAAKKESQLDQGHHSNHLR